MRLQTIGLQFLIVGGVAMFCMAGQAIIGPSAQFLVDVVMPIGALVGLGIPWWLDAHADALEEHQRGGQIAEVCKDLGMLRRVSNTIGDLRRFDFSGAWPGIGRKSQIDNVYCIKFGPGYLNVFDFASLDQSTESNLSDVFLTVAIIRSPELRLPNFAVHPKWASFSGSTWRSDLAPIKLTTALQRHRVRGPAGDPSVVPFFNSLKVRAFLENHPSLHVEGYQTALVIYPEYKLRPTEIRSLVANATAAFTIFLEANQPVQIEEFDTSAV